MQTEVEQGYEVIAASPIEVGLIKDGRGIRTWWAQEFGGRLPPLSHPKVQEAIRLHETGLKPSERKK